MPLLLSILDASRSKYCCLQTPPNNLIVYGVDDLPGQSTDTVCEYLADAELEFPGVIGSKEVSQRFTETWTSLHHLKNRVKMNMGVYRLEQVNEIEYGVGHLRLAERSDLDIISVWISA